MKKHLKKLDAAAAALLVGIVATMAIAQVDDPGPPTPVTKTCNGGTYTFPDGHTEDYASWTCPVNKSCVIIGIFVEPDEYYVVTFCASPA